MDQDGNTNEFQIVTTDPNDPGFPFIRHGSPLFSLKT